VQFEVTGLGLVTMAFKGGITLLTESKMEGGFEGVNQQVTDHLVSGDSAELGKVTISHAHLDTTPSSTLQLVSKQPLTYRQVMCLDCLITVSKPPGGGPPMQLMNPKTAILINDHLPSYPPKNAVYRLQEAVDLVPVGAPPEMVAAKLLPFAVTISS
jgi:hypothetical protein